MNTVEFGALFRFIRNGMNIKQDKSGNGLPISRIETMQHVVLASKFFGLGALRDNQVRTPRVVVIGGSHLPVPNNGGDR